MSVEAHPDLLGALLEGEAARLRELYPEAELYEREFSQKQRDKAASKGHALSHGGFPMETCGDVKNAISAIGRAKDRAATVALISRRNSALKCGLSVPSAKPGD